MRITIRFGRTAWRYVSTTLGLGMVFVVVLLPTPLTPLVQLGMRSGLSPITFGEWVVATAYLLIGAWLIILVVAVDREPLASIGVRKPFLRDIPIGLGGFAVCVLAAHVTAHLRAALIPSSYLQTGRFENWATDPAPWGVFLVETAVGAAVEELAFCGFAIERFATLSGSLWFGATLAYVIAVALHIRSFGVVGLIGIAPEQAVSVFLYLWRRNLLPGTIAHFLFNCSTYPVFLNALPTPVRSLLLL